MKIVLTVCVTLSCLVIGFAADRSVNLMADSSINVLVLPAYDEIANAGVSPDIQRILESILAGKGQISITRFPFKKLMNVPYQMVYDKKYCKPILAKVDCDIIVMSQIITNNERKPGIWLWAYKIQVYNVKTDKQLNSIEGQDLSADDFRADIESKIAKLIGDIERTFSPR